jgi:hypothetical protein
MEPSVQKFLRDFGKRVGEPDGPAHIYGSLPPADQRKADAQIQKNLDAAAAGAAKVGQAMGGGQ